MIIGGYDWKLIIYNDIQVQSEDAPGEAYSHGLEKIIFTVSQLHHQIITYRLMDFLWPMHQTLHYAYS